MSVPFPNIFKLGLDGREYKRYNKPYMYFLSIVFVSNFKEEG